MKQKITVDREENGILVCVGENEALYEIKREDTEGDISEGDICTADISDDGKILLLKKDESETKIKKAEMKTRLLRLFENKKQ